MTHGFGLCDSDRHRLHSGIPATPSAADRFEMNDIKSQLLISDPDIGFQTVPFENLVTRLSACGCKLAIINTEIFIGQSRMASYVNKLDLIARARFVTHHKGNVDTA